MHSPLLSEYISTFSRTEAITPVVISYDDALDIANHWRQTHGKTDMASDFSAIHSEYTEGLFLYETPEDKVEFPIAEVRRFISDTTKIPYQGKNLYILVGIDTASIEAMNALLKVLEDTPTHAIILLVVHDREALLETIHSRTIDLFRCRERIIDDKYRDLLADFFGGKPERWIETLFSLKPTREDAINLLILSVQFAPGEWIDIIEQGLIDLFTTNETPRNIIDRTFLTKET